jgi:hypothetical protein
MRKTILLVVTGLLAFQSSVFTIRSTIKTPAQPEQEDLSTLAGSMLDETNQPRTAIKSGNLELAQEHVNRADANLQKWRHAPEVAL